MSDIRIFWPIGVSKDMGGRGIDGGMLGDELTKYAAKVLQPGTSVEVSWMEKSTGFLASNYIGMINNVSLINDILLAEKRGFHGATVGGHWDPGLWAAREAARFPISGPGEAAMMAAMMLGRRFAFLTVNERYVPIIETNIRLYGLESRAISHRPVRCFEMTFEALSKCITDGDDEFVTGIEKTAQECIRDGADVVIVGGQLFGPAMQRHQFFSVPNTGVPLVEVSACGLKSLESMIELERRVGLRKSEHIHSPFRTPTDGLVSKALTTFGYPAP